MESYLSCYEGSVIRATSVSRRFGATEAVRDLTFEVGRGEIVGFLGPNGAGKTTTLRMLAGYLGLSSGRIQIAGVDVTENPRAAQRALGYMPESVPLYEEMRVVEYLTHRAELKEVSRSGRRSAVEDAMQKAGIADSATRLIGHLSKGTRQRVGLADALVSNPPLLILDEPTSGLDPNQIRDVRAVLTELAKDRTVILSTHILREVEATCSRVLLMNEGRLVLDRALADLQAEAAPSLECVFRGDASVVGERVRALASVARVHHETSPAGVHTLRVTLVEAKGDPGSAAEAVATAVYESGGTLRHLMPRHGGLESTFARLTAKGSSAAP